MKKTMSSEKIFMSKGETNDKYTMSFFDMKISKVKNLILKREASTKRMLFTQIEIGNSLATRDEAISSDKKVYLEKKYISPLYIQVDNEFYPISEKSIKKLAMLNSCNSRNMLLATPNTLKGFLSDIIFNNEDNKKTKGKKLKKLSVITIDNVVRGIVTENYTEYPMSTLLEELIKALSQKKYKKFKFDGGHMSYEDIVLRFDVEIEKDVAQKYLGNKVNLEDEENIWKTGVRFRTSDTGYASVSCESFMDLNGKILALEADNRIFHRGSEDKDFAAYFKNVFNKANDQAAALFATAEIPVEDAKKTIKEILAADNEYFAKYTHFLGKKRKKALKEFVLLKTVEEENLTMFDIIMAIMDYQDFISPDEQDDDNDEDINILKTKYELFCGSVLNKTWNREK